MPIFEALALGLCTSVAKSIISLWLKDTAEAQAAAGGMVDVIKAAVPDALAQRRVHRQFETIAESLAEDLEPLFERSGLAEYRQMDIASAAQTTIEQTPIDAPLLIRRNLDPTELSRYYLTSRPEATNNYSEFEVQLYGRVINRASSYVVDIASRLPHFTERSIGEMLKRESQLIDIAAQVLQELKQTRAEAGRETKEEASAEFEEQYRQAVLRNLDHMELFGVTLSGPSRRHRLSVAYVSLSVNQVSTGVGPHRLNARSQIEPLFRVESLLTTKMAKMKTLLHRSKMCWLGQIA